MVFSIRLCLFDFNFENMQPLVMRLIGSINHSWTTVSSSFVDGEVAGARWLLSRDIVNPRCG